MARARRAINKEKYTYKNKFSGNLHVIEKINKTNEKRRGRAHKKS